MYILYEFDGWYLYAGGRCYIVFSLGWNTLGHGMPWRDELKITLHLHCIAERGGGGGGRHMPAHASSQLYARQVRPEDKNFDRMHKTLIK